MKQILSVFLIVAVIGFINAQPAPTPLAACKAYQNSTEAAFCSVSTVYQVANSTDLAVVNAAAQSVYNGIIGQITNPTQACRDAVNVFSCQASIPKCGRYQPVTGIAQARCDAVSSACNITDGRVFPGNFTTFTCVRNTLASIDGQNVVCVPSTFGTLGGACAGNIFDPTIATPTTVQNVICPAVASCNVTASVCARPNALGDSCTTTCTNIAGSPTSTQLECLGGKCSYRGKRHAQTCTVNEECRSNNCLNGTCFESGFGQNCTSTLNCRDNLWCDTTNGTCYNNALAGEQCGIVQTNWSPVPCVAGFTCVRENTTSNSTAFSYCRANAILGQRCSSASGAIAYDFPLCDPADIPVDGVATCNTAGVCAVNIGQPENAQCNTTVTCQPNLTCKYATTSDTNGVCAQPGTVACDTRGGNQCNIGTQQCNCGTDVTQAGVCALSSTNPLVACAAQYRGIAQCLKTTCKSAMAPFIPYDGDSCGATQCLTEVNAYFCCVKNTVGANYVAPAGQPTEPCVTTTATPTGTPTPTPGSNTPTPTPSRSGAANVAVSFIAMIVAVIAFCL